MKDGKMIRKGIGLATWIYPGESYVKFSSQINQVDFSAQQVSVECAGVEVTGTIVWSVFREDDGPMVAYRCFGQDLIAGKPHKANKQIKEIASSIIRDRIANMTIQEILKNRALLREGVKEAIQKLGTNWGIWLETCEVTDVKILSSTLFENLQQEFKEQSRLESTKIQARTQQMIDNDNLVRKAQTDKIKLENYNKQVIRKE